MSEPLNFKRLLKLYLKGGSIVLHKILDKYSDEQGFSSYLYAHQTSVLKLKLSDTEKDIIVNKDVDKMDITLLCRLALCLFEKSMSANESLYIRRIRDRRNELLHSAGLEDTKIEDSVFKIKWNEMTRLLLNAAREVGEASYVQTMQEFINKTEKMRPESAEVAGLVGPMTAIRSSRRLDCLKDRFVANFEFITNRRTHQTKQLKTALDYLQSERVVFLYGKAGEGKSTVAFQLVKCLVAEEEVSLDRCVMLSDPEDFKEIKSDDVDLILIDDIFGKHNTETNKLTGWENQFDTLNAFVDGQNIRLITCCRKHIYMECKSDIDGIDLFSKAVELNSSELSTDDKLNILKLKLEDNNRCLDERRCEECISQSGSEIAFPLIASQFAMDGNAFERRAEFFTKSYKYYLERNIKKLDTISIVTLFFIFCKKNYMDIEELDISEWTEDTVNIAERIAKLQGVNETEFSLRKKIQDKIKYLEGSFLRSTSQSVSFLHDTIYEAVAFIYASSFPKDVLKYCTTDFLCQCVRVEETRSENEMLVDEKYYKNLAERFVDEVTKIRNIQRVAMHPCMQNEKFVATLISYCKDSSILGEFLNTGHSSHLAGNHGILCRVMENKFGNDVFFNNALNHLLCSHSKYVAGNCWKCAVKSEALASACYINRLDMYNQLSDLGARVTEFCFMKAVANPEFNQELAETVFTDARRQEMFPQEMTDSMIQKLSAFCVLVANNETICILEELPQLWTEYKNITMKYFLIELCLYFAVQRENTQIVSYLTLKLKESSSQSWTDKRYVTRALTGALSRSNTKLLNIMIEAGAKWTEAAAYYAVREHDYKTFLQVLQILKDNDAFDVESHYLAWALTISILHEDKRIYHTLNAEGVRPTTELVRNLVKTGQSVDEIRLAIEELRKTGHWDPKDLRIGDAYITACNEALTNTKQLLEEFGARICPSCLPAVIRNKNIPLFKQVLQELKKRGELDQSNKFIAYALILAKKLNLKEMSDRLINEGLTCNMAALPYAVGEDLLDIDIVVNELKTESKWEPNSDLALEALNRAYRRHDKSIYEKLLLEGIVWQPRSLYVAVKYETVFGLQRVVKQLNERGLLDSDNAEIAAAYALAMSLTDSRKCVVLKEWLCLGTILRT